jgi:hypothetical protein
MTPLLLGDSPFGIKGSFTDPTGACEKLELERCIESSEFELLRCLSNVFGS